MIETKNHLHRYFFLFAIGFVAITLLELAFRQVAQLDSSPSPLLFPAMTIFLLVFHIMVAGFMLMKYFCDKKHLYLVAIACAFAGSAIMMLGTLNSFPAWFICHSTTVANYNDAIIFFTFRNMMMAMLFTTSIVLFHQQKWAARGAWFHTMVVSGIILFTLMMLLLAYLYSSFNPTLDISLVDNKTHAFTSLWNHFFSWLLIALWTMTLLLLLRITQLRSFFWFSGGFFCICYIFTMLFLLSDRNSDGLAWYQARFFETTSTLFIIFTLLYDIFNLYRDSQDKYLHSYQNSIRDPLTRLHNRSYFYDTLVRQLAEASPLKPVSIIVSDLDRFKRINDTYGHLQGDKVIQFVASVLQHVIRLDDVAARIGGEEFALLLNNTTAEDAQHVAERIRLTIAGHDATSSQQQLPESITLSLGVYTATSPELTAEACVERADKAMYQAKETGRNRVVVWKE
ncbi:GGDEF domain-containing protein [Superficieibacter electus]|uniref:diguanylate cyclase n=1 Tax=Superficieibacter electus TaxID=2022662 RepID=A0A2P5GU19_9ENTR|nr:GGDEF domain-containing protein [Superficieibacter electus]POP47193.1 GGDEF domain-containing protein [Superficieibacter electus]POP50039.1 GGDEF domain-containing protein [Superficieibacter electus]